MRLLLAIVIMALAGCSSNNGASQQTAQRAERSTAAAQAAKPGHLSAGKPGALHLDEAFCAGKAADPDGPFGNAKACFMAACAQGDAASCKDAATYNENGAPAEEQLATGGDTRLEDNDYLEARKIVIDLGWQPVAARCEGVSAEICTRFPEIGNCSGTGLGFCDMHFSRKSRCLVITTTGGSPDPIKNYAQVHAVSFKAKPCTQTLPDGTRWP